MRSAHIGGPGLGGNCTKGQGSCLRSLWESGSMDTRNDAGGRTVKKLINSADDVIADALKGVEASDANVRVDHENRVIYRVTPKEAGKVGLRLRRRLRSRAAARRLRRRSACSTPRAPARCSPRPPRTRCSAATTAVDGGAGVLHIVKNYTGDVHELRDGRGAGRRRGIEVRVGRRRRRRRRAGLAVHRRPPRRRRHRAAGEDRRRRRRGGPRPRRRRRPRRAGERPAAARWAWR